MRFRNKILLSIWGVVLSLLVITFFIINYWIRARIEGSFTRELHVVAATVLAHEQLQSAQLIRACAVIAESPRLRAVAELGDARTATQLLQELNQTTLSPLCILTDRKGKPLVQLLRGKKKEWDLAGFRTIHDALGFVPSTDVRTIDGTVYRIVSVPVVIATELLGTLTIGFEISEADLSALKRATDSELLLVSDSAPVLFTLDSGEVRALAPVIGSLQNHLMTPGGDTIGTPFTLRTKEETYLGSAIRLAHSIGSDSRSDSPTLFYLVIKPFSREVRSAVGSILGMYGIVSALFLLLTTAFGLVISRSMTRPISALVNGTTEIARGNYDHRIHIRGKDELSFLGARFMEMSAALKEQITQLAALNSDLSNRNRVLDETLRELRAAQEQLVRGERLAATGKMTAQLAHEINNPIHNIHSCLTTALNRLPKDARGTDLILMAHDEASRLSRLTVQMLDFYRTSLLDDEMRPTDVSTLLKEVITLTEAELHTGKITLRTRIEPNLRVLKGSKDKLKQVFLNLIANARDAMPDGGELEMEACSKKGKVTIRVRDTGVGISSENLGRIFDAFFTTKGRVSGVGLGLSVSYGIVTQHGGTIGVESEVGRGATFSVILPEGD